MASGGLIFFLIVFTPWAFGSTQDWSIWTANIACYLLGALLAAKAIIRLREGYQPARWGEPIVVDEGSGELASPPVPTDRATRLLALLTFLLLGYVLISALNARAVYEPGRREFRYLGDPIAWLPHSYDRASTWFAFWQYLGLACAFWAIRDWLIQRIGNDTRQDDTPRWADPQAQVVLPVRLQRLLWVLCLNGALLALVGILQRASGTSKLLWILDSASQKSPENLFGPWSYRGNASQYFNLLWPVCLAFWLWAQERASRVLDRRVGRVDGPQILILPCAIFMAACPMITTSRGGAVVGIAIGVASVLVLLFTHRRQISPTVRWITVGAMGAAAIAALVGGWSSVRDRVLRSDRIFPTGIETATDDFTLLARIRAPRRIETKWRLAGGVSGNHGAVWLPNSFVFGFSPDGRLYASVLGSAPTNSISKGIPDFASRYANQEVQVAFVRRENLRVFVDGSEILTQEWKSRADPPSWTSPVLTRFAHAIDPGITSLALINYALTPEEVASAATLSSPELSEKILGQNTLANDAVISTNELALPEGASAELFSRPSDPSNRWIMVRRDENPGVVALRRNLPELDNRIRGPMRAAFTVWNPANDPILIAVSLDGGEPAISEIPGRSESQIDLPCRAPHATAPRVLDIYLADELGNAVTDAPPRTQFALRDIRLQTDGAAFVRSFEGNLSLADLSDRMSGRKEIYENARRMANDYVWWGSGPGTFTSLYQFYQQPGQVWAAYAHQDWLETRITFGRVGLSLIGAALLILFIRSWIGRGLPVFPVLLAFWWLALGGCLVHAVFDFPFQVYSIVFLFTSLSAVLLVLTGSRRG